MTRSLRRLALVAIALGGLTLAACQSAGDVRSGVGDVGSSLGASFGRNTDTNGTQRRMDVNNQYTRPSLPTITNR